MVALQPRWGGSLEAMAGFGEYCAHDVSLNPRFWVLLSDVYADVAYSLCLKGDDTDAVKLFDRALQYGDKLYNLQCRANSLQRCGRYDEAERDVRKILSYDPEHQAALTLMRVIERKKG